MMRLLTRTFRALLLVACLCAVSALPTLALAEPTIATPQTYRYHADIAITLTDSAATGSADGEIDVARQALRLTATVTSEGQRIRLEIILVDNRLYVFNEQRQRWEYVDLAASSGDPNLPSANLIPPLKLPQHPAATYQPAGSEQIGQSTVDRWRADGPYNVLLPVLTPRTFGGTFVEERLTIEAAIGANDRYLYRLTVREDGTMTPLGLPNTQPTAIKSDLTYSYSDFNAPVTIVAPPNAVPAPNGPGTALREAGTLLSRVARDTGTGTLPAIVRTLLPTNLPQP
jgi:hypothetical protein